MPSFLLRRRVSLMLVFLLCTTFLHSQDIVLEFCPVEKSQADKGFSAILNIRNNTSDVLDLANNNFQMEWPSLVSLPWPFSDGVQNGIDWEFKVNLNWPGTLAAGATAQKNFNDAKFGGVLQFPTSGTYTQDGKTYTVGVSHCATTNPYELYDAKVEFDRDCFIESPKSNMCLGEAASEIWQGEGVFDAMVPVDRPSWGIAVMVAHRLFTNLAGVEMLSPNFWTATALNESRMTCDPTIVADQINHWKINSGANTGTGIDTRTDNCFQVLNIGYVQISNNQPDLFAQTNAYGTASFSNVIAGGAWETGALAVTAYHYQDIRYWNQIYCWNANKFYKESQDPYAIEKIFYHAFHDGPNAGLALLADIDANYTAAINATDMHDVISTGGTWANLGGGSSRKVANFTSLLDGGDGHLYDSDYVDGTQEYYGCYEEAIKWSDIEYYLDKIKILYPHVMDAGVQADIKAVFDGLNGGNDVMFTNLGPVIDEIVIQMGGHDPSSYIATQYGASKTCSGNPIGVSLRTNDTICPGDSAELQVWLAGDLNFRVDIQFPDGSVNSYSNIDHSPYIIKVANPGDYEVVYFEDADEVGDINCNFAAITVESKNGSIVGWDKANMDISTGCSSGDLIVTKNDESTESVTISYTLDGISQSDIVMGVNETSKIIASGASVTSGEYIITTISPNSCGTPINDTITFCSECTKPQINILTTDTSICDGDTALVRMELTGTADYSLYYNIDGVPLSTDNIPLDYLEIPVWIGGTLTIDSLRDATCLNDTVTNSITIVLNSVPTVDLGADTTVCAGPVDFDATSTGSASYLWQDNSTNPTFSADATGDYWVVVTDNGCSDTDSVALTIGGELSISLGLDTALCENDSLRLSVNNFNTINWKDNLGNTSSGLDFIVKNASTVDVHAIDSDGCEGRDTIEVAFHSLPVVDLGADVSICTTSPAVTFDAGNAGADYLWSTGDNTQTIQKGNGDAGDYWVIVTENGCSDTDSVNLTVATELMVDLGDDFEICTGTTTVLDAGFGTGYTFDWNEGGAQNDQTFITGQGEVRVEVRDPGGCYGRDTVVITEVNPLVINLGADDSICSGDAALTFSMESGRTDVSVVGWQDGSTDYTLTSSNAGWYWLEVDSAGCVYRDSIEFTIHALPVVDLGADTFICVGTTPTISLTGGTFTTYQWADITNPVPNMLGDSETQDISSIGTYGLVVTDANGCVNGDTIQVTEEQGTAIGFTLDTTICPAGSATITVPSTLQQVINGSWTWFNDGSSGSSYTVSNESDGSIVYVILDFTNPSGCVTRDTAIVRVDNNLPISLRDTAICEGEDLTFSSGYPALGYTYTWQDNSTNNTFAITGAQASDAGVVSVSMESDEGCTGNASVQLTVNALPDPQLSAAPICLGEDRILDHGLSGVQSAWDHGETTNPITVTAAGVYRVTVTDGNNCEDTVSIVLVVNNPPSFTLPSDQTLCLGEEYALGTGMDEVTHTHQWFGGSSATTADISVTASGEYRVNVTEVATTCMSSDTVSFDFLDVPTVDLGLDTNLCEGDVATLSSPGTDASYAFTWSTTGSSNSIQVTSTGEYWLEASNGGCVDRDTISVVFFENPISELIDDVVLCFDDLEEELSLDPGRNGEEYLWSTGETSQVINVDERGTYIVNITNLAGCITQDYVEIKEDCPAHVWLPNSFTADGNSLNDVWMIQGRSIESVEVYVFNRWGELVWEGNALGQFWDGTYLGKPAQEDVYVYALSYTYLNVNNRLKIIKRQGRVTLLR